MMSRGLRCAISSPPLGFFTERSASAELSDPSAVRHIDTPAFRRVGFGLLQRDELGEVGEVGVVERVRLPHVAAGVELVEPHFARLGAFLKEEHHGLHARALERAAGAVEYAVEIALFEELFAQTHGSVVGVR